MSARRLAPGRIAVLLASALAGAAIFVGGFELLYWASGAPDQWHGPITEFDPELGWRPVRSARFRNAWGSVSTNAHGFRSAEIDPSREQIALVGDSVAWGFGVDDAHTLAAELERRVAPRGLQVANLGVSGYGLDQYYLFLRRHVGDLPRLRHVVLVVTAADDLLAASRNTAFGKRKPLLRVREGELLLPDRPLARRSLRNVVSHSYFLSRIRSSGVGRVLDAAIGVAAGDRVLPRDEAERLAGLLLEAIRGLVRERGAGLTVVLSPETLDYPEPSAALRWFRAFLAGTGADLLDFSRWLDPARPGRDPRRLFGDRVHYNARGNRVLAGALFRHLEARGGLPPARPTRAPG